MKLSWPNPLSHHLHFWSRLFTDTEVYRFVGLLKRQFLVSSLLLFFSILGLVHSLLFLFVTIPNLRTQSETAVRELAAVLPSDLTISYREGVLTTSAPDASPLNFPYPSLWSERTGLPQWLVVMDAREERDARTPARSDALITLTSTQLWVTGAQSTPQSMEWKELFPSQTATFTQADILAALPNWLDQLAGQLRYFALPVWIVFGAGRLLLRSLELFLFAWVVQAVLWMFTLKVKYWIAYRLGALLFIPAETCLVVWNVLYPQTAVGGSFWWIWTIFLFAVAAAMRFHRPQTTS